ncbi:MAG TPA: hypothetical protein GX706_01905 [Candidatus Moranbacteria bacterium]|nr:hypothetical protein [Candidatus Moranbacteria bacterium]
MKRIVKKLFVLQLTLFFIISPFFNLQAASEVPVSDADVRKNTKELLEELMYASYANNKKTSRYLVPINASVVAGNSNIMTALGEILGIFYQLATPGSGLTRNIYAEAMGYFEDEWGVDKDAVKRMMPKIPAPTVEVIFDNSAPKEGEKVTANAIPYNFKNSIDQLYFTWFIIGTDEEGKPTNTLEEGKRRAMGLVARGFGNTAFDPALYSINYKEDGDGNRDAFKAPFGGADGVGGKESECGNSCDGDCECLKGSEGCLRCFDDRGEPMFYGFDIAGNKDWFEKTGSKTWTLDEKINNESKGISRTEAISRCYKRNFGRQFDDGKEYSGRDLIVKCEHAFPTCDGMEVGDGDFGVKEEECWKLHPGNADTDGDGVVDEADLAGVGQKSLTWNYRKGDRVGVIVEGTSNIQINEGTTERLKQKRAYTEDGTPRNDQQKEYEKKLEECEKKKVEGLNDPNYSSTAYHQEGQRLQNDSKDATEYYQCMKELWEFTKDSSIGASGEMTSYHKIMSAGLEVCTEDKMDFLKDDGCDEKDDLGFLYAATIPVEETYPELYDVAVQSNMKNAQFNTQDNDSTDTIYFRSTVSNSEVNPDTLYYKWVILRCDPDDFDQCEDDVTETAETFNGVSGPFEGLGVKEIAFKPTEATFKGDEKKTMLKSVVMVKKSRNDKITSPSIGATFEEEITRMLIDKAAQASQLVSLTKNDMTIELFSYQARNGAWTDPWEICGEGLEKRVCPVFPYQVIGALVKDGDSGDISGYSWSLDERKLSPPQLSLDECQRVFLEHSELFCNGNESNYKFGQAIYFPIVADNDSMIKLSVTAERTNPSEVIRDDDLVTERILSVKNPKAVVAFSDNAISEKSAQGVMGGLFNAEVGDVVKADAFIVPSYLNDRFSDSLYSTALGRDVRKEASLLWRMDGYNLSGEENLKEIEFTSFDPGIKTFKARTVKNFSHDHVQLLAHSWGITAPMQLVSDEDIQFRFYRNQTGTYVAGADSVGGFFASTANNAPYYLLFILRVSITLVLIWAIFFGAIYFMGTRRLVVTKEQFK